jgi:hypothetical protein
MMKASRETIVRIGEADLVGPTTCCICIGNGSYACVHCEWDEIERRSKPECAACQSRAVHKCPRCNGTGEVIPFETVHDLLRDVDLGDGYRLQLWEVSTGPSFETRLAYRLSHRLKDTGFGERFFVLFEVENQSPSPLYAIDSDETLRSILGWVTLQPGDTDADYFDAYTEAQWGFAEGDAEQLSVWDDTGGPFFKSWGGDLF